MGDSPKRPAPPAPDPNWELELHPPAGARSSGPESRDPLLAHAVLHDPRHETTPLDLDLFDELSELGELERTTLPPPEAMSDHVARVMAEASLFEAFDDTGDRPTPLFEVPDIPAAKRSEPASSFAKARDPRPSQPREAKPTPVFEPKPGHVKTPVFQPRPVQVKATPAFDPKPAHEARAPKDRDTKPAVPAARETKPAMGVPIAAIGREPRKPTPPPLPVRKPTPPPLPVRKPTPPPFASASAFREASEPVARFADHRNGKGSGQYSSVSAPGADVASRAEVRQPAKAADRSAAPKEKKHDSLDFSDLPAVFGMDGLDVDEPAFSEVAPDAAPPLPRSEPTARPPAPALAIDADLDDLWGDSASGQAAAAPFSEPAISPPFRSSDLQASAADAVAEKVAAIEARIAAGDYGRALVLAEAALEEHPGEATVLGHAESCRDMLYKRYLERLGAHDHVPRLAVQHSAITALSLDHRAGFLLSCVDGGSTIEEIIDVSAMPRLEAVRLLYELVQEGVIEMASPR